MRLPLLIAFLGVATMLLKGQNDYSRFVQQAQKLYGQQDYFNVEKLLGPLLIDSGFLSQSPDPSNVLIYYFKSLSVLDAQSETLQKAKKIRSLLSTSKVKCSLILDFYEASALIVLQRHAEGRLLYQNLIDQRSILEPSLDSLVVKSYANIAVSYHMEGLWPEAENYYQETLSLLDNARLGHLYHETRSMVSANYLNLLFDVLNKYRDAANFIEKVKADPFNKEINLSNHHFFLMTVDYYLAIGEHQKFMEIALQLDKFYKQQSPVRKGDLGYLYLRKALYYSNMGNSTHSILMAQQAEDLMKEEQGLFNYLPDVYEMLAKNYASVGDEQATVRYLNKLIAINAKEERYAAYYPYIIAAKYYGRLNMHDLASCYVDSSKMAFSDKSDKNDYDKEIFHNEMAKINLMLKNADGASYHLQKLKRVYHSNSLFDNFKELEVETGMAYCDLLKEQPEKAIERLNLIQRQLALVYEHSPAIGTSTLDRYNSTRNINLFLAQAWMQKGRKLKSEEHIDRAWNYYNLAVSELENQQSKLIFDFDRISYAEIISDYLAVGYTIAQLRYEMKPTEMAINDLVSFSQREKSFALQAAINRRIERLRHNIRPEWMQEEVRLVKEYSYLMASLQAKRQELHNDSIINLLLGKQKLIMNQLDSLQKKIKEQYRVDGAVSHSQTTKTLKQIQQKLDARQVVLDYYFYDDECTITFIDHCEFKVATIQWTDQDREQLKLLIDEVRTPFMGLDAGRMGRFSELAVHFYQKLILPFESMINHRPLIIVPHRELFFLPFEVLIKGSKEAVSFKDFNYLVQNCPISYCTSLLLIPESHTVPLPVKGVTAFAPDYSLAIGQKNEMVITPLPGAQEEIDRIGRHWPVDHFTGAKGTKEAFMKQGSGSRILHFAMHAHTDYNESMKSGLVFTDERGQCDLLQAYEIYAMHFDAPLLTLNACSTADGRYVSSEGVMSLARAFQFAGIPSILTTLWPVNDRAGVSIMDYFYGTLGSELDKAEALRAAKLRFIDEADNITSHPYYWACYCMVGDTQALKKSNTSKLYIVLFMTVLAVVILFCVKKKRG